MNSQIDELTKSLLQKNSLEQCSVQELQQLSAQYPYFGPLRLLLTKKLQSQGSPQYKESLEKTSLLFHNPLWLQSLLTENGNATITLRESASEVIPVGPVVAVDKEEPVSVNEITEAISPTPSGMDDVIKKDEMEEPDQPEIPMKIPGFKIEAIDPSKTEFLFEPYHTIDYFASQGIKFREEEKPADKFGQQLKSFTEWLKVLRKTPLTEVTRNTEVVAEKKVAQMAEQSLRDDEVVTEAMAEVWEKQGNPGRAIEIYHKLSLLEPAKSAYFAAKIEDLKKTN